MTRFFGGRARADEGWSVSRIDDGEDRAGLVMSGGLLPSVALEGGAWWPRAMLAGIYKPWSSLLFLLGHPDVLL